MAEYSWPSRENAKVRKMEHERLCTEREAENQKLASEVTRLREEVSFLTKVLRNPKALNSQEQHLVELLLSSVEDLSAKVGCWGGSPPGSRTRSLCQDWFPVYPFLFLPSS